MSDPYRDFIDLRSQLIATAETLTTYHRSRLSDAQTAMLEDLPDRMLAPRRMMPQ